MTKRIFTLVLAVFLFPFFVPATAQAADAISVTVKRGEPAPTCKARATRKIITAGQVTTLVWNSKHADKMIGITKDGVWDDKGRQNIAIGYAGKRVFPMTFIGEGGIATCNVTVHVKAKKKDK